MCFVEKFIKNESGFSLIEVMAAIVLMIILTTTVIPSIKGVDEEGRFKADAISAAAIGKAVELYYVESEEDISTSTQEDIIKAIEERGYVKKVGEPKSRDCEWVIDFNEGLVEVSIKRSDGELERLYPDTGGSEQENE